MVSTIGFFVVTFLRISPESELDESFRFCLAVGNTGVIGCQTSCGICRSGCLKKFGLSGNMLYICIMKKNKTKKVQYFTDEMHMSIFPFQPAISSRGYGGNKPVMKSLKINTSNRRKMSVR